MRPLKLVLSGLGNVGTHFVQLLAAKRSELERRYGFEPRLVAVMQREGTIVDPAGLNIQALLARKQLARKEDADWVLKHPAVQPGLTGAAAVAAVEADVLVEATPTDLETGEPGLSHLRTALELGRHVVTLAKGPLVVDWAGLTGLARARGLELRYSGAAAAALPTLDIARYSLAGVQVTALRGILNGTSNYILSRMHAAGLDYRAGLAEAQRLGIAEPDPRLDVEGWDTAAKTLILANTVFGTSLSLNEIPVRGITGITPAEVAAAREKGRVIKLVGSAVRRPDGAVEVSVGPVELAADDPLARVDGTNKAVWFDTVEMGPLLVTGGRSDPRGAAAAALKDLINLVREAY